MREGLILQHAPTGPPGRLGEWAQARGLPFAVHRSDEASPGALDPARFGWIASLGSAHSANDDQPWIAAEVTLLARAVDARVPVLGLCWGGQALASALGAWVGEAPFAEKAWLAIETTDPAIGAGPWLHYHHEIFAIPDGAVALGHSPAGPSAFRLGPHLGLQFHPEADAAMADVWAAKDPDQTPESRARLAAEGARAEGPAHALAFALFDDWFAGVTRAAGALLSA